MTEKTPLVLLPGLLCDRELWRGQVEDLGDIASPWVADLTRDDSLATMARRVLATAPHEFALAGLSMGGYCALEILRQAPARVKRLALLDTNARADTPEQTSRRQGLIDMAEKGDFKSVPPLLLPLFLHPDHLKDAELTGRVSAMAHRVGKEAFMRQQKAIIGRIDMRAFLPRDRLPDAGAVRAPGPAHARRAARGNGGAHPGRATRSGRDVRPSLDHGAARRGQRRAQDLARLTIA